ncbi:hypothetical protein P8936_03120 [Edaphobacter paludis]|uniref:Uncharacterized protein n=1 Tax=Edaphobacter paludis TaxID=3035702 RepID=A0AAU7CZD1_9BACT
MQNTLKPSWQTVSISAFLAEDERVCWIDEVQREGLRSKLGISEESNNSQ